MNFYILIVVVVLGFNWVNFEDFNVIVENEFFGVVVVIEVVVRKLVELKFKLRLKVKLLICV